MDVDLAAAIADVRSNGSATDWCLCGYADGELNLKMVGSGTGGADALAAQLTDDNVYYGLVRTYEQIDATRAVKFVFLSFVGEGVAAMKKAKISPRAVSPSERSGNGPSSPLPRRMAARST